MEATNPAPSVKVGGVEYTLKMPMSLGTQYRMERLGINVGNLGPYVASEAKNGRAIQLTMKVLAAFLAPQLRQVPLDALPEYIADAIDDPGQLTIITGSIIKALGFETSGNGQPPAPPAPEPKLN